MYTQPLAYLITFTTYGSWLHGDHRNSVIRSGGVSRPLGHRPRLDAWHHQKLKHPSVTMDTTHRQIVLKAIIEHCAFRKWDLIAAHVRSNHVHTIVCTTVPAKTVSVQLKSWATRALKGAGYDMQPTWTQGASCRYIFSRAMLQQKLQYVVEEQGEVMQCYYDPAAIHGPA